jgi:hypothetical protein
MTGSDSQAWVMLRIGRSAVQRPQAKEPVNEERDVHAETIAVAVAEQNGEVRSLGVIPNREDSVRKLPRKLGPVDEPRFCYEAGPTGYVMYWSAGCFEAGAELSGRRANAAVGAGCGSRGVAGSGSRPRSGQER